LKSSSSSWNTYSTNVPEPFFYGTGTNGTRVTVLAWPNKELCKAKVSDGVWGCWPADHLNAGINRIDIRYGSKLLPPFNLDYRSPDSQTEQQTANTLDLSNQDLLNITPTPGSVTPTAQGSTNITTVGESLISPTPTKDDRDLINTLTEPNTSEPAQEKDKKPGLIQKVVDFFKNIGNKLFGGEVKGAATEANSTNFAVGRSGMSGSQLAGVFILCLSVSGIFVGLLKALRR
jgi:hypothetical protein